MFRSIQLSLTCLTLMLGMLIAVRGAEAQPQISSELLLPYFEVELNPAGRTTLFAVGNALDEPVEVLITLHSNWGIALEKVSLTLGAREVRSVNLRDWLAGNAPGRKLDSKQVAHLKAALSGKRSPQDSLFYSTEIKAGLAVGYVRIKTQKTRPAALWGDYFIVDAAEKSSQGEALVALGQAGCPGLCSRHILRYLLSGGFDGGTEVIVWTEKVGKPSRQASSDQIRVTADSDIYNEAGDLFDAFRLRTLPVQQITLRELAIKQPFGWLDLRTELDSFVAVRYRSKTSGSALLRTWCLPEGSSNGPGIEITKLTNGEDANTAPGPSIPVGGAVVWEYIVRNTGDTVLTEIEVEDDQGVAVSCPKTTLSQGESMTCSGRGTAVACQYANLGTVTARTPDGGLISAEDPSHYFGQADATIDLEKLTNGEDADAAPGPKVAKGAGVTWTYIVKNTGEVALSEIAVTDDKEGAVSCPKTSLRPDESMTCTLQGKAGEGQYRNVGTVTGETSCGTVVRDEDASHYHNLPDTVIDDPEIDIEKHTNGQDADTKPGPEIETGKQVRWDYFVTNTGNVALSNVKVTDDKEGTVSCPKTSLAAGETMTCTLYGTAVAVEYANLGTATGKDPKGKPVSDTDPSHYFGVLPKTAAIDIEKHTNGQDADAPKGPEIEAGTPVLWEYFVTNTGQVALTNVKVTDDQGVAVSCPKASLAAGESMRCTGNGTAVEGQYKNLGTVTAKDPAGKPVSDSDPSHYFGLPVKTAAIDIEKHTNGQDADAPKGPEIETGKQVRWDYFVTNTGNVALSNVKVTDDKEGAVSCPKTSLAAGETMTCTLSGTAVAGQYANLGTVTAKDPAGKPVSDSDPSHYFGVLPKTAAIDIEKHTNGHDADTPKGPEIEVGKPVLWEYFVTNTGEVALSNVKVTDDMGVAVSCPKTSLAAGESMRCTGNGTAVLGQYKNLGTATGKDPGGKQVSDTDPSHYFGYKLPSGNQGCTPGYWKNHADSWPASGYSTGQKVQSVFGEASRYSSFGSAALIDALSFQGGSGVEGAVGNLLRAATASLLNSAHPGVDFPRTPAQVAGEVDAALASGNRDQMLSLASALDADNNLGCPLN